MTLILSIIQSVNLHSHSVNLYAAHHYNINYIFQILAGTGQDMTVKTIKKEGKSSQVGR